MADRLALGLVPFFAALTFAGAGQSDGPWLGMLGEHEGTVCCMAFSPDGKTLAVGGGLDREAESSSEVQLWEVASRRLRGRLRGHTRKVRALAFAPDGTALATVGDDGTVRVWDLHRAKERIILRDPAGGFSGVAFAPNGKILATDSEAYGTVRFWDAATGRERGRLPAGSGTPVAFIAGGKRLVTVARYTMQVWDVALKKRLFALAKAWDLWVAVSPDGGLLAAGSQSESASLWEAATGKLRFTFPRQGPGDS
jgi:WD40 repeat protein